MKNFILLFSLVTVISCKHQTLESPVNSEAKESKTEVSSHTSEKLKPKDNSPHIAQTHYKVKWIDLYKEDFITYDTIVNIDYFKKDLMPFYKMNYKSLKLKEDAEYKFIATNDTIKFEIIAIQFDSLNHTFMFDESKSYLKSIDNKSIWGVDDGLPKVEIKSMNLFIGSKKIEIDNSVFANLYEPHLKCYEKSSCSTNVYITDKEEIILTMENSDGAAAYTSILIFDLEGNNIHRIVGHQF